MSIRYKYPAEYQAWINAKYRCFNPKSSNYTHYGGRGITVCSEWKANFKAFIDHIGPRPSDKHSLDRIDNDGNYAPGNVRWATAKEQANNQRSGQKRMDLRGQRYGRLTPLYDLPKDAKRVTLWRCLCDCGNEITTDIGHLRNGHTQSCGCWHREITSKVHKGIDLIEYRRQNGMRPTPTYPSDE